MSAGKKIAAGVIALLAIGLGVFLYGGWQMFGDELKAIRSLKMIEDKVYTFTYKGDYGFKGFLEQGGAKTDAEMAVYIAGFLSKGYMKMPSSDEVPIEAGCTALDAAGAFGRNFDFEDQGQSVVIVRTEPDDGYKSISTSTFAFLGFGPDWHPVAGMDGFMALASIYVPLDGMNEKGLCVADLIELDGDTVAFDTPRPDLTIVGAIRLVLDYAASVDEALELLERYDVHPSIGKAHHLSVADGKRAVAVEWKDGRMHVTETSSVTNHCLWESRPGEMTAESRGRLEAIRNLSPVNMQDCLDAIKSASYDDFTIWTALFNRETLEGTWYFRTDWDKPVSFEVCDR